MNTLSSRPLRATIRQACFALSIWLAAPGGAFAANRTFSPTSGDWLTKGNWSSSTVPTINDTVYIGSTTANRSATIISGSAKAGILYLGYWTSGATGGSGSLTVGSGGSLTVANYMNVGDSRNGTLILENGGTASVGGLEVGLSSGITGTLTIDGVGSKLSVNSANSIDFGYNGGAVVTIRNGGTFENTAGGGDTIIGAYSSQASPAMVTVTGSGSQMSTRNLIVGNFGSGNLSILAGAHVDSTDGDVASGSTNFDQTRGSVLVSGTGSQWTITNQLAMGHYDADLGYSNTSSVTVADGAVITAGGGVVLSGSTTSLNIGSGGLSGTLKANVVFGYENTAATLNFNHTDDLTFAYNITSQYGTGLGIVTKSGAGTTTLSGNNTYTGGTYIYDGTLRATTLASALGAGTVYLKGGSLELANNTGLNFGQNTEITANATITSNRLTTSGASVAHTLGTLSIGGNKLTVARGSLVTGTASLIFGATTLTADDATFNTGAGTLLTLGALSGNYRFTKEGAGQLTLGTASTRNATTTLTAGILRLQVADALGNNSEAALNLNGGILELANNSATTFNGTAITLGGNATIQLSRTSNGNAVMQTLQGLTLGGDYTLTIANGSNFSMNNAGSLATGDVTLSGDATVALNNTNGTGIGVTTFGALNDQGAARTLTKSGNGTLTLFAAATTISNGTTLKVTGGRVNSNNATALGMLAQVELSTSSTFALGASQTLGALKGTGGTVELGSYTLTLGSTNHLGTNFGGAITGTGGLVKTGTGTAVLSGTSTYTGSTLIYQGRLQVDGKLSGTSGITIGAGATLGGTGRFTAAATIQGIYAPGNSVGKLASGSLAFDSTGVFEWELSDALGVAGTGWDLAEVTGGISFTLGSTFRVISLGLQNFDAARDYSWTVATTTTGITGVDKLSLDFSGFEHLYDGNFSLRVTDNVFFLDYEAVPEPSTVALLVAASALVFVARRFRVFSP